MITHVPMKHGWYYFYRYHKKKINAQVNGFSSLQNYLTKVEDNCPHDYFLSGPRSSSLNFKLKIQAHPVAGHEISHLAKLALVNCNSREAHNQVELFLLSNDNKTIAVEVPIWLLPNEIPSFNEIFKSHC